MKYLVEFNDSNEIVDAVSESDAKWIAMNIWNIDPKIHWMIKVTKL